MTKVSQLQSSLNKHQFNAWETKSLGTVYQALTDGFVVVSFVPVLANEDLRLVGQTDSNNPPTIVRVTVYTGLGGHNESFTMPVRKGDYWKIASVGVATPSNISIYWIGTNTQ